MNKIILFNEEAQKKIRSAVDKLANTVKITLGPKGKVAVFERNGKIIFTLDGVTIAKNIYFKDHGENMTIELMKEIAGKTDKEAGDGTTTATILAQSILHQGLKAITAGIDNIKLMKGIEKAVIICKETLKNLSKKVKTPKEISDIATISSRNRKIGEIVSAILEKLGQDATIAVETSQVIGLHQEIVEGMKIDKGYINPYFITDIERGEVILENPYILTTSQVLSSNENIIRILNEVFATDSKSLLIIANEVKGQALATLIMNKVQGRLLSCAIQSPGIGDDRRNQLEDISILTGSQFIAEEKGTRCEDVKIEDLGKADRVIVNNEHTIIVGGKGNKENIKKRISFLRKEIQKETSDYEKELKEKRLARIKGGVAVIKVGSMSEQETMEKRYRIEDAVKASKSAIEEGIVIGGGFALCECSRIIESELENEKDLDFRLGMDIIAKAIKEPARQIIINAEGKPDIILEKCQGNIGYNSAKNEFQNLLEEGIIDSAKVIRCALENAVSIVSLFLKTEALIVNEEEKKKDADN